MFFNVIITIDDKEKLNTDCFHYNAEKHYLKYHVPFQDKDSWVTVSNVECDFGPFKPPLYFVYAKTIKEVE